MTATTPGRLRWHCPACLLEFQEPFCTCCGAHLTVPSDPKLRGDAMLLATVGHPLVNEHGKAGL